MSLGYHYFSHKSTALAWSMLQLIVLPAFMAILTLDLVMLFIFDKVDFISADRLMQGMVLPVLLGVTLLQIGTWAMTGLFLRLLMAYTVTIGMIGGLALFALLRGWRESSTQAVYWAIGANWRAALVFAICGIIFAVIFPSRRRVLNSRTKAQ